MAFGKLQDQMSEINVTPFVDVMLVLLIIFMVTAPLMQQGVDVDLPQANAGTVDYDEEHLMVVVNRKGHILLQDQRVDIPTLSKKLKSIHKDNPDASVYLSADRKVAYGVVVQTIAAIKGSGIARLGMITEPEEQT